MSANGGLIENKKKQQQHEIKIPCCLNTLEPGDAWDGMFYAATRYETLLTFYAVATLTPRRRHENLKATRAKT
jgi:hypothetical protein